MRVIMLLLAAQVCSCADLVISKEDIASYIEKYNSVAKESDHKIAVPIFLKIAHPDAPLFFMIKNMDLNKPLPPNMKYGNKPII